MDNNRSVFRLKLLRRRQKSQTVIFLFLEFKWLQRVIKALFALGDVAFRELIVYFDRIPFNGIPAWIQPDFNVKIHTVFCRICDSKPINQFLSGDGNFHSREKRHLFLRIFARDLRRWTHAIHHILFK